MNPNLMVYYIINCPITSEIAIENQTNKFEPLALTMWSTLKYIETMYSMV